MRVHLVGVGGTAMAALAAMLQDQGHLVSGSDAGVYPPMSDFLAERKIAVWEGFKADHVDRARPDLVIIGNVVRRDNPEAVRVRELGLAFTSLPAALGEMFLAKRRAIVVAGTHGKTTTTALTAWLLTALGADPSCLVGGLSLDLGANFRLGRGEDFVIEGDEYDTAFFDKVPKFVHYRPQLAILTGVEYDHADIYPDPAAYEAAFARLTALLPPEGRLVVCADDGRALALAQAAACPKVTYGRAGSADYRAAGVSLGPGRVGFNLIRRGRDLGRFTWSRPGRHNLLNALAGLALLLELGHEVEPLRLALAEFQGVKRRQEVLGAPGDVLVVDDFAHHPTAVRETLAALKAFYPERRLVAVFEPRSNTSRRRIFQAEYAGAFGSADLALIREPGRVADLAPEERFSAGRLAADLAQAGLTALAFAETERLLSELLALARPGDLVAVLSNGGFDGLPRRLLDGLTAKFRAVGPTEPRRISPCPA